MGDRGKRELGRSGYPPKRSTASSNLACRSSTKFLGKWAICFPMGFEAYAFFPNRRAEGKDAMTWGGAWSLIRAGVVGGGTEGGGGKRKGAEGAQCPSSALPILTTNITRAPY